MAMGRLAQVLSALSLASAAGIIWYYMSKPPATEQPPPPPGETPIEETPERVTLEKVMLPGAVFIITCNPVEPPVVPSPEKTIAIRKGETMYISCGTAIYCAQDRCLTVEVGGTIAVQGALEPGEIAVPLAETIWIKPGDVLKITYPAIF